MPEITYVNSRGQITIPSRLRSAMRLREGSAVVITKLDNKLSLYPTYDPNENIMKFYGAVKVPKGKSVDPEVAIKEARKIKALEDFTSEK